MSAPWITKYLPKNSSEVVGQDAKMKQIKTFILNYKLQKKKAMIVYGAPGSGKTSSIHAIGEEFNLEIIELNASDFRNKDKIQKVLGAAANQMSLFAKGKIILVDEIEGVSGTKDRGGLQAVIKIFEKSSFPVVLTAINPFDQKLSTLRKKCAMTELNPLTYTDIYERLKIICEKEDIKYEERTLKGLARHCGGDMRAAINDLQTTTGHTKELTKEDVDSLSARKQTETINSALLKIFKSTKADLTLGAFDNVNEDMDKIMLWLDENIPKEYEKPQDLVRAYDCLSKADIYNSRIRRWQHWRFMVYIYALLSAGIATAKDEKYKKMINFEQSKRPLEIWMANMKYQKRKAIAEKIARHTHTSTKVAINSTLPYVQSIIKRSPTKGKALIEEFEFEADEIAWLKK